MPAASQAAITLAPRGISTVWSLTKTSMLLLPAAAEPPKARAAACTAGPARASTAEGARLYIAMWRPPGGRQRLLACDLERDVLGCAVSHRQLGPGSGTGVEHSRNPQQLLLWSLVN